MDLTLPPMLPTGAVGTIPSIARPVAGAIGTAATNQASAANSVMQSFGSVLAQAVQDVNVTQQVADSDAARLAAGDDVDIHQAMMSMEKANLSMSFALQVRNKVLDAYQEVMRMVV